MYLHGVETAPGERCLWGEICHPVYGTIRVVHGPRLYHHCHPSWKIKLISHMSARFAPFTYIHAWQLTVSRDIIWNYVRLMNDYIKRRRSNDNHYSFFEQINTTFVTPSKHTSEFDVPCTFIFQYLEDSWNIQLRFTSRKQLTMLR